MFSKLKEIAEELWGKYKLRDKSFIVDMFYLQIKSTLACPHCKSATRKYEVVNQLTLPIQEGRGKTTLYDCLQLYTSEKMSETIE